MWLQISVESFGRDQTGEHRGMWRRRRRGISTGRSVRTLEQPVGFKPSEHPTARGRVESLASTFHHTAL